MAYQIEVKQYGQWLKPDLLAYVELAQAVEFAKQIPNLMTCDGVRVKETVTNSLSYELDLSADTKAN